MAVLMIAELPGMTAADYDAVNEKIGIRGDEDAPDGLIQHLAGETADGLLIADVWESPEQFERFFAERAGPAIAEVGGPRVEPRVHPVHNMIRRGSGTDANVLLLIDSGGFTPEAYDAVTSRMAAHAGDGTGHPADWHVAAESCDGMVFVDVWDSPESFGRFAQEQLGPSAGHNYI